MADFGINATQLSDAQGAGTQPVAPVQEQATNTMPTSIFQEIGEVFANGIKASVKANAAARQASVIGEYVANENIYGEALRTGQWNASQTSMASRANYSKFLAAHPQYITELKEARMAVMGGSNSGEADRIVQAENKQREADIGDASKNGYVFYSGMSEEAQNASVEANKTARRIENEWETSQKRINAQYAANSEQRSQGNYGREVETYAAREQAFDGARSVAAKNFDAVLSSASDIIAKVGSGQMTQEQASEIQTQNISRVRAGLNAVAGRFPEASSMWAGLFSEMDSNIRAQLDPTKKSESEVKLLRDRMEKMKLTAQILAVEKDPELLNAVAASELFRNEPVVMMTNSGPVKRWLLGAGGSDPLLKSDSVVGTPNDKEVFGKVTQVLQSVQSGKIQGEAKPVAEREALGMVNKLLEETQGLNGEIPPSTLKEASKFFASPEFGRLALDGRIDKQTAANAQYVFQTKYEPAVRTAILSRLDTAVANNGEPLSRSVEVALVGGKVVFQSKDGLPETSGGFTNGWIDRGMRGNDINAGRKGLKEAEEGLNQLIRLHAHLEGTTDYANYWDKNKHQLMPNVFPDPAKLKPGQVVDGKKYIGGNYGDKRNWVAEPTKPGK